MTMPPNLPEAPDNDDPYLPPELRSGEPERSDDPVLMESPPPMRVMAAPPQGETPTQRLMWGCGGGLGCLGVLGVVLLVLAIVTAGTFNGAVGVLGQAANFLINPTPPAASVVSTQTIVTRVQPLGQLVSTRAQVAKADIEVNIQQARFGACDHNANHVAAATIEAGIDLMQLDENAIRYDAETDTYTLMVPRPVITSCSMDFIDQYDRQLGVPTCSVDWDDARQIAQYEALRDFRDDAIEGGLLQTAERDARQTLIGFVSALTGSNVIVEFVDVENAPDPAVGCNPEPPRDWMLNETTGQWVRTG